MHQSIHRRHKLLKQGSGVLNDLVDVTITNPQDGEVLAYEASSQTWVNLADFALNITSPSEGQILVYDSGTGKWINSENLTAYPAHLGYAGI